MFFYVSMRPAPYSGLFSAHKGYMRLVDWWCYKLPSRVSSRSLHYPRRAYTLLACTPVNARMAAIRCAEDSPLAPSTLCGPFLTRRTSWPTTTSTRALEQLNKPRLRSDQSTPRHPLLAPRCYVFIWRNV